MSITSTSSGCVRAQQDQRLTPVVRGHHLVAGLLEAADEHRADRRDRPRRHPRSARRSPRAPLDRVSPRCRSTTHLRRPTRRLAPSRPPGRPAPRWRWRPAPRGRPPRARVDPVALDSLPVPVVATVLGAGPSSRRGCAASRTWRRSTSTSASASTSSGRANQISWSPSSACDPGSPTRSSRASPLEVATGHQDGGDGRGGHHEGAVGEAPPRSYGDRDRAQHRERQQDDDRVHDEGVDRQAVDEVEHGSSFGRDP